MRYSKKFQSKKVLVEKVTQVIEAAIYNKLNAEKEGIEFLYDSCEEDVVEGVTFTYANTARQIVSATFKKVHNMDATWSEQDEEMNDDATYTFMAINHDYKNLSVYFQYTTS